MFANDSGIDHRNNKPATQKSNDKATCKVGYTIFFLRDM